MKQLLPQLDTLIRTYASALRESDLLTKILELRTFVYRVLEATAKAGTLPVTLQQAITLCQQMNNAIQMLNSGKYTNGNEAIRSGRTNVPIQGQIKRVKQIDPEAVRLAELLAREEVRDFEEDCPNSTLDVKIECLADRIVVTIGDLAKLIAHPGYPAIPVDIESDALTTYTTITNCLRYFEDMSSNKDEAL